MDVTKEDHVKHAMEYVAENLPAGEQGKRDTVNYSVFCCLSTNPNMLRHSGYKDGDRSVTTSRRIRTIVCLRQLLDVKVMYS